VVRASSLETRSGFTSGRGQRGPPVGPEIAIPTGVWHEMSVRCKGNQITCGLDGKELINVTDKATRWSREKSRIGRSRIRSATSWIRKNIYVRVKCRRKLINGDAKKGIPRLLDLKIYVAGTNGGGRGWWRPKRGLSRIGRG